MNLKPTFFALTTALLAATAHAKAVDWTPYLKGMQDGCDVDAITPMFSNEHEAPSVPKPLKSSVTKYGWDSAEEESYIQLKNAAAFGQPLVKISDFAQGDGFATTLHFANANFMKLLPQFQIKDKANPTSKYWVQEINPSTGKVIKRYHLGSYTQNTTKEIIAAFHSGIILQSPDMDGTVKEFSRVTQKKLSAHFRKHHQTLINQLVDKYRNHDFGTQAIQVYQQTKDGYHIADTDADYSLSFDAKNRTISCSKQLKIDTFIL